MDEINKSKHTNVKFQTMKLINRIENRIVEGNAYVDELALSRIRSWGKRTLFFDTEFQKSIKLDDLELEILKCDEYNSDLVIWKTKTKQAKLKLETCFNKCI